MNNDICMDVLRSANARLASFFARFSGAPVLGTAQEVEALSQLERALHSVGNLLKQGLQQSQDPAIREELSKYGAYLLRLRLELSCMQDLAIDCRARVSERQKHLHAAQAWFEASQATH
jgi:hypothetical protein